MTDKWHKLKEWLRALISIASELEPERVLEKMEELEKEQ